MSTFFGSLLHQISLSNIEHCIWFFVAAAIMIVLAVIHHKWKGNDKKIRLRRLLCLLPIIIAAVHALIYLMGFPLFFSGHLPLYAVTLFALLPIPFAKHRVGYKITVILTGLATCLFGLFYLVMSPNYYNHL